MTSFSVAALDLETVPDADAITLSPHARNGFGRTALHRLVAASVVLASESAEGFSGVDVRTFTARDRSESEILSLIDCLLPHPNARSSRLITYNGRHADLRFLKLRMASLWMFDARGLADWVSDPIGQHIDLIETGFGSDHFRWSLPDLCAGLGFPIRQGVLARSIALLVAEDQWDAVAEHNMMDAVGTFLAYAYVRSMETGRSVYAASAWVGIADALRGMRSVNIGRQDFSDHYLVDLARVALSDGCPYNP